MRLTKAKLLEMWPAEGSYNLLHLPYCHKQQSNTGKAFVNCVSHEAALAFQARWQGVLLGPRGKVKALDIGTAEHQGFNEYLLDLVRSGRGDRMKKIDMPVLVGPDGTFGDFRAVVARLRPYAEEPARRAHSSEVDKTIALAQNQAI